MVIGLHPTAVTTGAWAREFRAADPQSEDYPAVQALRHYGRLIAEHSGGRYHIRMLRSRQFDEEHETITQTRIGAIDRYAGSPAAAGLIERIRRMD